MYIPVPSLEYIGVVSMKKQQWPPLDKKKFEPQVDRWAQELWQDDETQLQAHCHAMEALGMPHDATTDQLKYPELADAYWSIVNTYYFRLLTQVMGKLSHWRGP